ncbi:hypothetical protein [Niallia sp. 01092]|uniref:hypothetical protein n=1 Tax=unclassified Niallia TaxID=2837522 RepID=UPI003FD6A4C6
MSDYIIDYTEVQYVNFNQASIAVDACFLLAYLDVDDQRGDKVSELLAKWAEEEISELVITNKVAAEVVHNLFKNIIREILFLVHKMNKNRYKPSDEELELLGDLKTARNLAGYVPEQKLDKLVRSGELYHSIESILKDFKTNNSRNREGLHTYYNHAVSTFQGSIRDLSNELGLKISTPSFEEHDIQELALNIMRIQQLDVYDAFHIAYSSSHGCHYFATLDSDFIHTYYTEDTIGLLKILKIA